MKRSDKSDKDKWESHPRETPKDSRRVVVKFQDEIVLPDEGSVEKFLEKREVGPWGKLKERFPSISIRTMFYAVEPDHVRQLVDEAQRLDKTYQPPNILNYCVIDLPAEAKIDEIVRELGGWSSVQTAYYDPPADDPGVSARDPRLPRQGYLDAAPAGIDAKFAWLHQGGDGAGQQIVDLEQGWTLNHQDLVAHHATLLSGDLVDTSRPHGTSVLGVICAAANNVGCIGIAPNVASVDVVSYSGRLATVPAAMLAAIAVLPAGGVLLLEVQRNFLPTETLQADFDSIRLATARGITVVEAAGNGGIDLDNFTDPAGNRVLKRVSPAFKDSGAVMVGAATSAVPHSRWSDSNFGSRIDCYAWGENVDSPTSTRKTPFGTKIYTETFNGTSSASPIIAGAALLVQGMAMVGLGQRFNAFQMRTLLSNPATGTPSNNPAIDRIGVMPDLRAIINTNAVGLVPLV